MHPPEIELPANRLFELLPRGDRARLLALCEPTELMLAQVLFEPGDKARHVYFPTQGFVSLITTVPGHSGLEVGMVGREGMLGAQLALGVDTSPVRAVVQGMGNALRVDGDAFRAELQRSPALQRGVGRYLFVLMAQLATSSACVRFHLIGPRLARWLLMTQDRAEADTFHVTQESMGYMLGVRRESVTEAAGLLQDAGLIEYRRGEIGVLDRAGLEHAACSCYAADRKTYDAQL